MEKKIFKSLDSTNSKAQEMISAGEINDTFWLQAEDQKQGRGMGSNTWLSEPGKNITGSLVIFPSSLKATEQFRISVLASLAVCDLMELYFENVSIKWPNDILLDGLKAGGLLVENAIMGNYISHSVVGLGLNVNQVVFPPELGNAASFKQKMGLDFNLTDLCDLLLEFLEGRMAHLENRKYSILKDEYASKLYRYKEFAPYRSKGIWFRARILDVDHFGHLILESETGDINNFGFKEVEFID
jgi:BirA family biotin operon repressor/biotin-[acetyl-CoA-carboxylase] ligase